MRLIALALAALGTTSVAAQQNSFTLKALLPVEGGLLLQDVIDRATALAPAVLKAHADLHVAEKEASTAYTAFFPRLDVSAAYNRNAPYDAGSPFPGVQFPSYVNTYDLRASLAIPASDYFLVRIHGYDAVRRTETLSRHALRAAEEAAALRAAEAFFAVVRADANTEVARRSVATLASHLTDVQRLAAAGLATPVDALKLEAQLSAARVRLDQAEGGGVVARTILRRLLQAGPEEGLESGESLQIDPTTVEAPPSVTSLLEACLAQRSELKALTELIEIREASLAMQRAAMLPRLNIVGSANYTNPDQRFFAEDPPRFHSNWTIGANLTWSPNDLVLGISNRRRAERDLISARNDLDSLVDGIAIEVAQAVSGYRTAGSSIGSAEEGLRASEAGYHAVDARLSAGDATASELVDTEADLTRARLQLASATLDFHLARVRLRFVQGRLTAPGEDK